MWHLPTTIAVGAEALLAGLAAAPALKGRRVRRFGAAEWARALEWLPQSNPLYPFRVRFKREGLGPLSAHEHAATSALLAGGDGKAAALQVRAYTAGEVDRIAAHIVANSSLASDEPLVARTLGGNWFFAQQEEAEGGGEEEAAGGGDEDSSSSDEEDVGTK